MSQAITVRDARASDESAWRLLWDGYTRYYETTVAPEVTAFTWQRILDPSSQMIGRVAELDGRVVGFSISVLHDGTWSAGKVCYLEDLFVDPAARGKGVGRRSFRIWSISADHETGRISTGTRGPTTRRGNFTTSS